MLTGKKIKINFFFWLGVQISLLSILLVFSVLVPVHKSEDKPIYVTKPSDRSVKIGDQLGSPDFRKSILNADKARMGDNLFYPGQGFIVPVSVNLSERFIYSPFIHFAEKSGQDESNVISSTINY